MKQPDKEEYAAKREQLQMLMALAALDQIDLRFADETGFSLVPYLPYAWLAKGVQTGIPSATRKVLNVFALLSTDHRLTSYPTKGRVNSEFIINCLEDFLGKIKKPTVVVLDQASWHTSQLVKTQINRWQQHGLYLFLLPKYSPQLNPIEILWRFIKYKWLKPKDYLNRDTLYQAVCHILTHFGSKYSINFSKNFDMLI